MSLKDLKYNHQELEKKWQDKWFDSAVYHWNENSSREDSYVIDTPPPTVSGLLHMGHIFSYTQADFIARYKRMKGFEVFYPIGFDDNGLPTERLVEKVKNIRGSNMNREEFIKICHEVVKDAEEEFRVLFKSVALSFDWRQEYQTISKNSRKMSQLSFIDLFRKGLVYRSLQPTLWDIVDQTALAQADIVDKEQKTFMHDIIFKTPEGEDITIATTRPELLPACVAVFVHPDDMRYKHLIGTKLISPVFKVIVPVIADEKVEIEKGSGVVMCCTFGDTTDIYWWRNYKLPLRQIIEKNGRINTEGINYAGNCEDIEYTKSKASILNGMKIKEARAKIIELLQEDKSYITSSEVTNNVKCAERSGVELEILITHQWSIKVVENKEKILERLEESSWHPEYMRNRIETWIEGLNWDWCISRQRFFGVPFPVWYSKRPGEEGKILVADPDQLPVDPLTDLPKGYNKDEVIPDYDVMDTWATSSISPQLNSLGITKDLSIDYDRHQKLFPADLRPQAHEIIRTWAFYTIVKSLYHEDKLPWKNLMISGWCLAEDKTKMSKSKGNVVTPTNLILEKGADVVRYWASNSRLGADIAYSEETFKIGKKLITKIWNAAKFAAQYFENIIVEDKNPKKSVDKNNIFEVMDLWMLSKLHKTIANATKEFDNYEYSFARSGVEDFFWNVFCDNYLEIIKTRAYDEGDNNPKGKKSAVLSLYFGVMDILRLFAPFIPHVTEELYQRIYQPSIFIHQKGNWPKAEDIPYDNEIEQFGDAIIYILLQVRKMKSDNNLSMKSPVNRIDIGISDKSFYDKATKVIDDLKNVTQSATINISLSKENEKANYQFTTDNSKIMFDILL